MINFAWCKDTLKRNREASRGITLVSPKARAAIKEAGLDRVAEVDLDDALFDADMSAYGFDDYDSSLDQFDDEPFDFAVYDKEEDRFRRDRRRYMADFDCFDPFDDGGEGDFAPPSGLYDMDVGDYFDPYEVENRSTLTDPPRHKPCFNLMCRACNARRSDGLADEPEEYA